MLLVSDPIVLGFPYGVPEAMGFGSVEGNIFGLLFEGGGGARDSNIPDDLHHRLCDGV